MKWIYDKSTQNPIVIVSVTTLVLLLNVGGWSTSTRKGSSCLSRNDPRHRKWDDTYKSGLLSKEISTTSKTISVLQDAEPKMRGLCMLI